MDCTVDSVVCETVLASDLTGPVESAHTVLTGPLIKAELVVIDAALSATWKDMYGNESDADMAGAHRSLVQAKNLYCAEIALDRPEADSIRAAKDPVYCLRLFTWETYATGSPIDVKRVGRMPPHVWFLVLRRSSRDKAAFERVGVGFWDSRRRRMGGSSNLPLFDGAESTSIKIV